MSDVLDFQWYATHMQQVCNTNINDMYRTFFSKELLESVLLSLDFVNRIYKLLNIKVGIYFLGQSHCTGMSHNLLDNRLVYTSFC